MRTLIIAYVINEVAVDLLCVATCTITIHEARTQFKTSKYPRAADGGAARRQLLRVNSFEAAVHKLYAANRVYK